VDGSELAFRELCRKYGTELCYSPMLHAGPFVRDPSYRTRHLSSNPADRPLIVQVLFLAYGLWSFFLL